MQTCVGCAVDLLMCECTHEWRVCCVFVCAWLKIRIQVRVFLLSHKRLHTHTHTSTNTHTRAHTKIPVLQWHPRGQGFSIMFWLTLLFCKLDIHSSSSSTPPNIYLQHIPSVQSQSRQTYHKMHVLIGTAVLGIGRCLDK